MTTQELIDELEEHVDNAGSWDVRDDEGREVTGVRLTPKGIVLEVER